MNYIPANPGFYALFMHRDEVKDELWEGQKRAVVGWVIKERKSNIYGFDYDAEPIILDDETGVYSKAILQPDGSVIEMYVDEYESEAKWRVEVLDRYQKAKEARKFRA